jgi:hypothetical protein
MRVGQRRSALAATLPTRAWVQVPGSRTLKWAVLRKSCAGRHLAAQKTKSIVVGLPPRTPELLQKTRCRGLSKEVCQPLRRSAIKSRAFVWKRAAA